MNVTNVIRAVINATKYTVTAPIVKEDYGLYLQIEGADLPEVYEVDFSNEETSGGSVTMLGNADGVLIPRQFIKSGRDVYAFLYFTGEDFGRTVYKFRIPNKLRPDRTNAEPTPEEQSVIDQAIAALNGAVTAVEGDVVESAANAERAESARDDAITARDGAESAKSRAVTAETTAGQYASDAAASALRASNSASDAEAAKTAAVRARDNAESARDIAIESRHDAVIAKTAAESARDAAILAQTNAETAQSKAEDAQAGAESARSVAVGAANDAESSAQTASASATTATTKANEASASATAAQTAQTAAETAQSASEQAAATLESILPTDSASGSIASFPDGSDLFPAKSVKVNIDPVQDLHGYENPWPAGGGKNKFNALTWVELGTNANYYSVSENETIVVNANDVGGVSNRFLDVTADATYSFLSTFSNVVKIFDSSSQTIITGSSGTFTAPSDGKIAIKFYASSYPTTGKFVLVEGSTIPTAWTPYSNICPISGWTGANVWKRGINIWDEQWEVGTFDLNTGNPQRVSNYFRTKNRIAVIPGNTYFVSISDKNVSALYWFYYDKNDEYISYTSKSNVTNYTITIPENCHYVRFVDIKRNTYNPSILPISINYPSTDTEYHAYAGTTYPISWQTEAGTVYGGTLDVVSGELVVDRGIITLDGHTPLTKLTFAANVQGNNWNRISLASYPNIGKVGFRDFKSNVLTAIDNLWTSAPEPWTVANSGASVARCFIGIPSSIDSAQSFSDYVSENPIQIVYELATPTTYHLTPTEVQLLLGQNNVWSDTGDSTVTYKADVQKWVEKKLG